MLKLAGISKEYKTPNYVVKALDSVDMEFRESEFVSVLGPSGCGKTTLLNIVGGLDRYTAGNLIINGKSTKDYKSSDWDNYRNKRIGFVFQTYNLIHHLSILANVEMGLTIAGIKRKERRQMAVDALTKVGLGEVIKKKPSQLSGGQMQRVAIARSIVNNPDILLADEPTGALDSKTSIQVLDILKEISKEKLVIMVTHNENLAKKYSNRIINLLDGKVVGDSNPYTEPVEEIKKEKKVKVVKTKRKKSKMTFFTSFMLSFRNLLTKKGRTFLTAFAGSIGIIGVALILALSTGFQSYIDKVQSDTLSNYPLSISAVSLDINSLLDIREATGGETKFPIDEKIYVNSITGLITDLYKTNNITQEYIDDVVKNIDEDLYYSITYNYSVNMNLYKKVGEGETAAHISIPTTLDQYLSDVSDMADKFDLSAYTTVWQELMDNYEFLQTQYDVIEGKMPETKNEIVVIVDQYNRIPDVTLKTLGLLTDDTTTELDFADIIGLEYKLVTNNNLYTAVDSDTDGDTDLFIKNEATYEQAKVISSTVYETGETLEVVGILRRNASTNVGSIQGNIGYSSLLTDWLLETEKNSAIVEWQENNVGLNPLTGSAWEATTPEGIARAYAISMATLGGTALPSKINIYPVDFDAKQEIKNYLDAYNDTVDSEDDKVYYNDVMGSLVSMLENVVNGITYVLIAFTAVSLIVSSIMIGIITYVSVLERTKEIGILRSLGARKKDIARVFMSESSLIGLFAGIIGIVFAYLLTIPLNAVLIKYAPEIGNVAVLPFYYALTLVGISIILTLVSGFIPARIAARKDPVVALRSE